MTGRAARHSLASHEKESSNCVDFSLNEEQKELQKWAHDFAENEIRPVAGAVRRDRGVPVAGRHEGRRDRHVRLRPLREHDAGRHDRASASR